MHNFPIGIIDSGIGGLSVWQEIVELLPEESTVYLCDQKNIPYGEKSVEEIYLLAKAMVQFLLEKHVKMIVIACNTITVSCLDRLREEFPDIPMIGAVPVVKLAAELSKHKKIGVLSTTRTAESEYQKQLIQRFASDCEVISEGTDALVPLIERGDLEEIIRILPGILKPFQKYQVDTLALGCTHYPFIERQIEEVLGENIRLLDSGKAIARHVQRILEHNGLLVAVRRQEDIFYTTGDAEMFKKIAKKLLNQSVRGKIGNVSNIVL